MQDRIRRAGNRQVKILNLFAYTGGATLACAAAGAAMCSKRPDQLSKAIILAIMVEFYIILTLLASFLMLNSL